RAADRPAHDVRARGGDLRDRRGRAVAARRPRGDRARRRDRGAGGVAGHQQRRLLRARADRPRLAALGSLRPRDHRRPDGRAHARPRLQGVARARALRAEAGRHGSRGAARRVAARPRACPRLGRGVTSGKMTSPPPDDLAPMREQVYKDPRPAEHFDRFHERARTREPDWVYEVVRVLTTLYGYTAFRARCLGAEHVPSSGKVIVAPNHFSFMDHFLVGMFIRRRVRFMAKSQLFTPPMQWIYTHGGVFPVRRGAHDDEAFITAEGILERGGCVVMYPEAGRSRTGKLTERARPGIGRLVLESGAPVVPVAIFGSSKIRNWKRLQFPKAVVQYG